MAGMKSLELDIESDSDSKMDKRKKIIDIEPSATIATTQIQPEDLEETEEGDRLFSLTNVGEWCFASISLLIMEAKRN